MSAILRAVNFDISPLLNQWEFKPGEPMVRRFKGKDGLDKIQLRLDLVLLQMNADGRPDGKRPFEFESFLDHYRSELARHLQAHEGYDEGFKLSAEDCTQLQLEAIQYHHRSLCLFQLEEYTGVVRDTDRNLAALDFVERYAGVEPLVWALQQFRPQLLMIRTRAMANQNLHQGSLAGAIRQVKSGIKQIRAFLESHQEDTQPEDNEEIKRLEEWLTEMQAKRPMSKRQKLEKALQEAVRREDYEKAALYRDALRSLRPSTL
jgi:protein-arginine kinase activator protein McsA